MEIIDEEDEEIKQLMIRISNKEITLCETCDAFFDYVPQKVFCDECQERKRRELKRKHNRKYKQRPEVKERERKRKREYFQRPEVKEQRRKYARERYHRLKKLREEEWFLLDGWIWSRIAWG